MIALHGAEVHRGRFQLQHVSFTLETGQYGVVIGPTGSGKTTMLEAIAGLLPLAAGRVELDGRDMRGVPPEERRVGVVYQRGYLFPHLTVRENVTYGADGADAGMVNGLVERFGIGTLLQRSVESLSGGERQLVALVRTLVRRPRILLLDEPFSALDHRRRARMRREVRALHREWGLTTVHVTHDFAEAGLLGDWVLLLDGGCVLQSGVPTEVFRRPASPYAAEFLGAENVLAGVARRLDDGAFAFEADGLVLHAVGEFAPGPGHAVIRAEEISLARDQVHDSARNRFAGRVVEVQAFGPLARVTVDVRGVPLVAAVTARSVDELGLVPGLAVVASFKAMAVHLC